MVILGSETYFNPNIYISFLGWFLGWRRTNNIKQERLAKARICEKQEYAVTLCINIHSLTICLFLSHTSMPH